jgi:hypothetical protein
MGQRLDLIAVAKGELGVIEGQRITRLSMVLSPRQITCHGVALSLCGVPTR